MKDSGIARTDIAISNFLRSVRVKYLIKKNSFIVEAHPGRYGGTFFSDGLFDLFLQWVERKPIPLLSRKEYEIDNFLSVYFGEKIIRQYKFDGFIYDWYVPSINLFIEFNETTHSSKTIANKDKNKRQPNQYEIHENTAMKDLAVLARRCSSMALDYQSC